MTKKMLIDAAHPEETRVVVVDGNRVEEFDFESQNRKQLRGNIYLAKITRVEPSLQAAFVEYGGNRHGFLAFNEIHPDYYQIPVAGKRAVVIGRGNVVGKPMAALLTARDATVTLCHSRTSPLEVETLGADLIVLAAGFPDLLNGSMIQPGTTVVDFGVNVSSGKVFGDANAASVIAVAGGYTPVPGGTTPVTTMVLARNTVTAAYALANDEPEWEDGEIAEAAER